MNTSHNGFCLAIAWPETQCKQAGGWYDGFLYRLGINKNGYYKVGHAALVLISDEDDRCQYFDFGRYHAPHGHGRVRSAVSDHDLEMKTLAQVENGELINVREILAELYQHPSSHGDGAAHGAVIRVDHEAAHRYIQDLIAEELIPYGPFIRPGTNCSRFVNSVLLAGRPGMVDRLRLISPFTLTPTPMSNLRALSTETHIVCEEVEETETHEVGHAILTR